MKIKEIVSRFRGTFKEFRGDTRTTSRYIWSIIWTAGLFLMEREKNLHKLDIYKTVDLETEEVNLLETSCVPLNCMGCRVKIPSTVENKNGLIYKYIASPDLSTQFKLVSPTAYQRKKKLKNTYQNYAFLDNGYIYFDKCYPCIKVSYLPDSWEESISSSDGCSKLEQNSPLPDYILYNLLRMSLEELSLHARVPFDTSQNKNPNN